MTVSIQEQKFFQDFSELLKKHTEMDGKFSLWRIHQHHDLREGEVLHETSDSVMRTSTVKVINKDVLPESSFVSQWVVKADGSIIPTIWCCD